MLKEKYKNYDIEALPYKTYDKRWAVSVKISVENNNKIREKIYTAEDKCWYLLEIEAAKESINLGKRLIDKNLIQLWNSWQCIYNIV